MSAMTKKKPGITNRAFNSVRKFLHRKERVYHLGIPKNVECEHTLLLGDPGSGKTQTLHQFLLQVAERKPFESAIIYDPVGEFVARHYNENRGDIIFNPLDVRSPFWSPSMEVRHFTDKQMIAESFFPGKDDTVQSTSQFFIEASRAILGRMLDYDVTPHELVRWLKDGSLIDLIVAGTEYAHLIAPSAPNQRGGVLGVMSKLGNTLRLLPGREDCEFEQSLTDWAKERGSWIFITSTFSTRSSLRPLQAVFLNLLMKRLMSVSPEEGRKKPCWFIVDEVHSLKRMPALYEALTEGRKFGLNVVMGTQGKTQLEEYYGALARVMLSAPRLKIFYRCDETDAAKWVSDTIGEAEVEKPKISTTASVEDKGRDAINYSTVTERKPVISKEQIMSLDDLEGLFKFKGMVVPFKLVFHKLPKINEDFIQRKSEESNLQPPPKLDAPDGSESSGDEFVNDGYANNESEHEKDETTQVSSKAKQDNTFKNEKTYSLKRQNDSPVDNGKEETQQRPRSKAGTNKKSKNVNTKRKPKNLDEDEKKHEYAIKRNENEKRPNLHLVKTNARHEQSGEPDVEERKPAKGIENAEDKSLVKDTTGEIAIAVDYDGDF